MKSRNHINTGSDSKIESHDIYETFWRCRDFEISNLWQRSVFLTAFIVLCFTGYGSALSKLIDNLDDDIILIVINIVCYFISLVGIIFSIMWIKMSKGSKAWYEIYERAIEAIEKHICFTTTDARKIGGFTYNSLRGYRNLELSNDIFSGRAGEFSPSRINIGIGQVFLIVWLVIGFLHSIIISYLSNIIFIDSISISLLLFILGVYTLVLVSRFIGMSNLFRSGAINWFREYRKID